jgi:hypothetical protein
VPKIIAIRLSWANGLKIGDGIFAYNLHLQLAKKKPCNFEKKTYFYETIQEK